MALPSPEPSAAETADSNLLAEGREHLETLCLSTRYRYLYPEGPNLALLFWAYQDLDRWRLTRAQTTSGRRHRRVLRRLLRTHVRRDVQDRLRRLDYRYPTPRLQPLPTPSTLVAAALDELDGSDRTLIESHLGLAEQATGLVGGRRRQDAGGLHDAMARFRAALYHAALRDPSHVLSVHPQILWGIASAAPSRRRHPLALFFLVRVPLQALLALVTLFNVAYVGAYFFFNDEVLGRFVSARVSRLFEGDLELGSVHWNGRLIFDLVTGTAHDVVVRDVDVWGPYKSYDHGRRHRAAHAERLEIAIVLHEIIPWNRLGVPQFLDIPWVLHFTRVRSQDAFEVDVVEYEERTTAGELKHLLSLRDAFVLYDQIPNNNKGLTIVVEDAEAKTLDLSLDMSWSKDWEATFALSDVSFDLRFDAPEPDAGPVDMPFAFDATTQGGVGNLRIGEWNIPIADARIHQFRSNRGDIRAGNVGFAADLVAGGSPVTLEGGLVSVFGRFRDLGPSPVMHVNLDARSVDADEISAWMGHELELRLGTFVGHDSPVHASISGPVTDPLYALQARSMALDLTGEPSWIVKDVSVGLTMSAFPIPEPWQGRIPDDGAPRNVVRVQHLEGAILGGKVELPRPESATIVMPGPGGAYFIQIPLVLEGIDPAGFVPDAPSVASLLGGRMSGRVDVHELVIGQPTDRVPEENPPMAVLQTQVGLEGLVLNRHRGPEQDHIPRQLAFNGNVALTPDGGLDVERIVVTTDGTRLDLDGHVDLEGARLDDLDVAITIDDGVAFADAVALSPYFSAASASARLRGPFGAPSSSRGQLVVVDLIDPAKTSRASLRLQDGVLMVDAPDAHLLGGRGAVDLRLHLSSRGQWTTDPRLYALVNVHEIDLAQLPGDALEGRVDIELELGDGQGNASPISDLRILGAASAETLGLGGTVYRDASVSFQWFSDELAIERLVLPIHRPVSPFNAGRVTVPVGELTAEGTITIEDDPALDLRVGARGVPLDVVRRLLSLDADVRGQIGRGTQLTVGGTVSQPKVDGIVALSGLSAEGIALGDGKLEVTSDDVAALRPLGAHRELRVRGDLATRSSRRRSQKLDDNVEWTVDSVVALARLPGRPGPSVSAQLDVTFHKLSIANLIFDPSDFEATPPIDGTLHGVSAHVLTCGPGAPTLSDCVAARTAETPVDEQTLAIALNLDRAWVRGNASQIQFDRENPCRDPATICTQSALNANLRWPRLDIEDPWVLSTGGDKAARLEIQGTFDLASAEGTAAPVTQAPSTPDACKPPPPASEPMVPEQAPSTMARVRGALDFRVLSGLLPGIGLETASGRLKLDVSILGRLFAPNLTGHAELEGDALLLDLGVLPVPLDFKRLGIDIHGEWLLAQGSLALGQGLLNFGSVADASTGYAFSGPCAGHFGIAAQGRIGSDLLGHALGSIVTVDGGGMGVRTLIASGSTDPTFELDRLEGQVGFGAALEGRETCTSRPNRAAGSSDVLSLEFTEGLSRLSIDCGTVDFEQCDRGRCDQVPDGWYRITVGGGGSQDIPRTAVHMHSGPRGEISTWGRTHVSPDFDRAENTDLQVRLEDLPYRSFDGRGRLAYEADLSGDGLNLSGGQPLVATGSVRVDRGRYVKDAIQGVEILTLTDEVDTAKSAPPPLLEGMRLDLHVETDRPMRIENNLAHGVQANLSVDVTGSYETPELVGRVEVEPGGRVDVPFLTGQYEIQRGRILLLREWENAEVDVVAQRQEPVYIQNQPRRIQLLLGGTLSAMHWSCVAEGDTSGELDSLRACTEYLVLGTGDVQISDADVRRFGGGGLANARKPLQVVSHLTEIDVGEQAAEAAPRLRKYVPDVRLRLGQIGPEFEIATPASWFDWGWGQASVGWDYVRGYPGFLLRQSREFNFRLQLLDPILFEIRHRNRSYLNNRLIFDPLEQTTLELKFDLDFPSLR